MTELRSIGLDHPRRRVYGCDIATRLCRAFGGGGGGTTTTKADIPPELAPMMTQTGQMVSQIQKLLAPLLARGVQFMPQQIPGVDPYQQMLLDTLSGQIGSTGGSGLMPQSQQVASALANMYSPGGTFEMNLLHSIGNTLGQDPISGQRMGPNSAYTDPGQLFAGISHVLGQNPITGAAVGPNAAQGAQPRGYAAPSVPFTTGGNQSQIASLIAGLLAALQGAGGTSRQSPPGASTPVASPAPAPTQPRPSGSASSAPAAQPSAWQSLNPGYPASGIGAGNVQSYIQYSGKPADVMVRELAAQGVNTAQVDAAMGWQPGTAAWYANNSGYGRSAAPAAAASGSEQAAGPTRLYGPAAAAAVNRALGR